MNKTNGIPSILKDAPVPVTGGQDIKPVYANFVAASATMTDFRLFFNELGTIIDGNNPRQTQEAKAIVVLPIAATKALIELLTQVSKSSEALKEASPATGGNGG
jgi:hypothetical protein